MYYYRNSARDRKKIAEQFSADGAVVYACDRLEGIMDGWAKQCTREYNIRVIPLYFDVTDTVAVKKHLCRCIRLKDVLTCL